MLLIRLTGVVFAFAGWLFYRGARRACSRGWIGSRRRRVDRAVRPMRFRVAVGLEFFGALVCFAAAWLCFTHSITMFGL